VILRSELTIAYIISGTLYLCRYCAIPLPRHPSQKNHRFKDCCHCCYVLIFKETVRLNAPRRAETKFSILSRLIERYSRYALYSSYTFNYVQLSSQRSNHSQASSSPILAIIEVKAPRAPPFPYPVTPAPTTDGTILIAS